MPGLNLTPGGAVPDDLMDRITALEEGGGGGGVTVSPTEPEDPTQAPVWVKTPS
jgi:hypothetical protein